MIYLSRQEAVNYGYKSSPIHYLLTSILFFIAANISGCGGGDSVGPCQSECIEGDALNGFYIYQTWPESKSWCIEKSAASDCNWYFKGEPLGNYRFYYLDADGDGWGNPDSSQIALSEPVGYVSSTKAQDCDDTNASIKPFAAEVIDGVDNNCDGQIDEIPYYRDKDGDSFGNPNSIQMSLSQPVGYVLDNTDCDDNSSANYPGATEVVDGIDNNCDGQVDEGFPTFYQDSDGDSFGNPNISQIAVSQPTGYVLDSTDCDDSKSAINPGATEVVDGIDNDCDTQVDEGFPTFYLDNDGDSYGDPKSSQIAVSQPSGYVIDNTDCDDADASINPLAQEVYDSIDNNCDGQIDEGFVIYYLDSDGDLFGDPNNFQVATTQQPVGYVTSNTDCDDTDAAIYPDAIEIVDGIDNNCNGFIDESFGSILNDTGITWGGNYPDGNNTSCIGDTIDQQDCSKGRDTEATVGNLSKTGGGHAGFDFTKLDSNGTPLVNQSQDYITLPWACVLDNHTGLVWEVKTDDGEIHDKDNTYRWGGLSIRLNGDYGKLYDDWNSLVEGSNNTSFCSFNDWRVPSREELLSIVNYGVSNPSIDGAYFPNTESGFYDLYWSASASAASDEFAWSVTFLTGENRIIGRLENQFVRLVRGGR